MQGQASEQQQLAFFATATATVEDIMNEGSGNSQYVNNAIHAALGSIA